MIAQMSSNVHSSANVNLILNVFGDGFNTLTVQRTAQVIRQVTPVAIDVSPNVPEGTASIAIRVKNNSRLTSSSSVRIVLTDALGRTLEQNIGKILAGQESTAVFQVTGLNPIDLIKGPGIAVRAQMFLGDLAVDDLSGTIFTRNPTVDLPNAFAKVAQDPSLQNLALPLLNELAERIRVETDQIERRGYKDQPGDTYLFGALAAYRGRLQSDNAKQLSSRLASQIWPYRKAFSNFLGIKSANRIYFESACRELNNGRKL
jgi:hypothetical protein